MFLEILLLFGLQHSTEKSSQSNLQKSKRWVSKKYDEKDADDGDDDYEQQFEEE